MQHSPAWEPNSSLTCNKFPAIFWNWNVPHSVDHRTFHTVLTIATGASPECGVSSAHPPSLTFLCSTPKSTAWSLSMFPLQNLLCMYPLSHPCHLPHSSHPHWYHHNNNWRPPYDRQLDFNVISIAISAASGLGHKADFKPDILFPYTTLIPNFTFLGPVVQWIQPPNRALYTPTSVHLTRQPCCCCCCCSMY